MSWRLVPPLTTTAAAICAAVAAGCAGVGPVTVIEHEGPVEWLIQVATRLPAIGVVYAGGADELNGPVGGKHAADWVLLVVVTAARQSPATVRNGEAGEVGAWELLARVRAALVLNDLELEGLSPLEPIETELLGGGEAEKKRLAIYQMHFQATHEWRADAGEDDLSSAAVTYETPNSAQEWAPRAEDEIDATE